ncbi:WW domain-containing oxidoreductase [Purpureocillium lilacinum]|uniref:WW domain-containing oxidoreductase n=1 Tax=Purpureocillium lilacinum TaxID=33203 RepID=A0A179HIZ3_PURLI|nr:WW domain-containing oxidoreductase [Purpureocillium lilacinum]OAQ90217.1 WW domain-containing oxidoreductase [Purpureocillium lilacinum]PWI65754.1 hypothetical protein PCL_06725 [Purpureocillium lilacinum]GJN67814.1 hypothetical protein PLICBS_001856 [Purpureocillium lilacinum]
MPFSHPSKSSCNELVSYYADATKGKTILTTGVSPTSISAPFVRALATAGPRLLILAGRNLDKLQQVADEITTAHPEVDVRLLQLDLGSLSAVRKAAEKVNVWDDVPVIDVLVTNAGIMATPYVLSPDGYESQFAVNHLAHFLFVNLVMDKLLASPSPRVVSATSKGHRFSPIRWGDINFDNGDMYDKWAAYGQSKTANILLAISLANKLGKRGLQAHSVHPGTIAGTGLASHLDMSADVALLMARDQLLGNPEGWNRVTEYVTPEQGAATYVFAAFEPSLTKRNGAYLLDCRVGDPYVDTIMPWATSSIEAERLWRLSESIVGQKFTY